MTFKSGENVGPYRILMKLGQGGMATVYKAYHAALDRYVAIKVLHPVFMEDESFLLRFRREAQVVARLDHPHIVPVYDYAEHEGQPYLVMKFIEGETLKARMMRSPLTADEILAVVEAVGSALGYAHREGILHRDIKPSNVILATNGHIYLTDFGLARIAESGASTLTSDRILGTPQYISPEQAVGKEDLDAGTDIYSFGVMLYEILVGRVPFSADTPFSIIHDHIYTPLPLPREVNPDVPEPLERVLLKALAKERADRYETADEMVAAFRQAWTQVAEAHTVGWQPLPPTPAAATTAPVAPTAPPAPANTAPATPTPSTVAVPAARGRIPWGWVTAGVLLVVLLVFGGVALGRWLARPTPVVMVMPTNMPHMTPMPGRVDGDHKDRGNEMPEAMGWHMPDEVLSASAAVQEAWDEVMRNPADPWAYQQLAENLSYEGYYDLSAETIARMLAVARPAPETRYDLALRAYNNGMNLEAVEIYQSLLLDGQRLTAEARMMAEENLYIAAAYPEATAYIDWGLWYDFDPLLAQIAEARMQYYYAYTDVEQVMQSIEEVLVREPGYPLALIAQAEIYLQEGKMDVAAALLDEAAAQNPSEWMAREIDFLRQMLNDG